MGRFMPQKGTGMFYVNKRALQVTGDDIRPIGSPVPEAFDWSKTHALLASQRLVFIPSLPQSPPTPRADPPVKPEPVTVADEPVAVPAAKDESTPNLGPGGAPGKEISPSQPVESPVSGAGFSGLKAPAAQSHKPKGK